MIEQQSLSESMEKGHIYSDRVVYLNSASGQSITGYFDHKKEWRGGVFIIIPPAYGETKKDYISLSYYLVVNGFNVIRYDSTCHLGESEGEIEDATLSKIGSDLVATIDFIEKQFREVRVGIVATSLAARVAMKVTAHEPRVGMLINLVGVVSLEDTLRAIYREDIIGSYQNGKRWGTLDIFGHEVKDNFIQDAIGNKFHDFRSTVTDLKDISVPIIFFAASEDAWIQASDVRRLIEASANTSAELLVVEGAMHQLQENPRLAKSVICQIVSVCLRELQDGDTEGIAEPSIQDIVRQNQMELRSLRSQSKITREGERGFWKDYLSKFSIIFRSPDYQDMMRLLDALLKSVANGDRILDAGCGNGHFGIWLLKTMFEGTSKGRELPADVEYVSFDFIGDALEQARVQQSRVIEAYAGSHDIMGGIGNSYRLRYVLGDLEEELPFADGYFNKICCNLVISYLENPIEAIRGLVRTLAVGGRIVVSSLKPYCDLSLVYRNFTEVVRNRTEAKEALALLSSTGKIKKKESEGHYHFYTEEELSDLLTRVGLGKVRAYRTLGNQANVVVGERE